jgi:hypothetical protein
VPPAKQGKGSYLQLQITLPQRLAGVANEFPLHLWNQLLPQTEITLNLIQQLNAPQQFQHMYTSADHLITTKCCLHQWDVRHKSMRRLAIEGHGCTIQLTGGISSPPQNIIAHTRVMSRPPKANAIQTQSISNTNTQHTPPSPTLTK